MTQFIKFLIYFCKVKNLELKSFFKHLFDLYIILNVHVALAISALYLIINQEHSFIYLIFLGSATILSYNFIRLISFSSNRMFIKKYYFLYKRPVIIFLSLIILTVSISFFMLNLSTKLSIIPLMMMTLLYNFDYKNLPKFRDNGIIKILIVGFVWTGLTVLVPNFEDLNINIILKSLLIFLYVVMLTIGFDKRDILVDKSHLKTLPQLFPNKMFVIYLIFFGLITGLNFLIYQQPANWLNELIIFFSTLMSYRSNTEKSFYYTAFWLEAMPMFWLILMLTINR